MSQRRVNGMAGIQVMPFPFLNPWNWGAMSFDRAVAASGLLAQLNLDIWRAAADSAQSAIREQQDLALRLLQNCCLDRAKSGAN